MLASIHAHATLAGGTSGARESARLATFDEVPYDKGAHGNDCSPVGADVCVDEVGDLGLRASRVSVAHVVGHNYFYEKDGFFSGAPRSPYLQARHIKTVVITRLDENAERHTAAKSNVNSCEGWEEPLPMVAVILCMNGSAAEQRGADREKAQHSHLARRSEGLEK